MATAPPATWTTRTLLAWMTERFTAAEIEPPRLIAEMLLSDVLDCERMRLYMEADRATAPDEREKLRAAVKRALDHEPVQYIVGWTSFYSLRFDVAPVSLIPQPCSEDLVHRAIDAIGADPARVLDIGTGTGCIAVTIAAQCAAAEVVATDVVPEAIELATRNAERHKVTERLTFLEGSLFEPVAGETFDVILSNPPYISDAEWDDGQVERCILEHVPESALRGGADGLDLIRPLLEQAPTHLNSGGLLIVEVADAHAEAAAEIAANAGLSEVEVMKDSEGFDRFVVGRSAT